jgi:hypothetical protein
MKKAPGWNYSACMLVHEPKIALNTVAILKRGLLVGPDGTFFFFEGGPDRPCERIKERG